MSSWWVCSGSRILEGWKACVILDTIQKHGWYQTFGKPLWKPHGSTTVNTASISLLLAYLIFCNKWQGNSVGQMESFSVRKGTTGNQDAQAWSANHLIPSWRLSRSDQALAHIQYPAMWAFLTKINLVYLVKVRARSVYSVLSKHGSHGRMVFSGRADLPQLSHVSNHLLSPHSLRM